MRLRGTHVLVAYGPVLVLSFYAAWLAGRLSLGYWPRPSLDDPKDIDGFWMWTYDFAGLVLLCLPAVCVVGSASLLRAAVSKSPEWRRRLAESVVGAVLLVLAVAFMRWDPQGVVAWYFD